MTDQPEPVYRLLPSVKPLMRRLDVTQGELARRLGTHASAINRLLNGKEYVNWSWGARVAQALEIDITAIIEPITPELVDALAGQIKHSPQRAA